MAPFDPDRLPLRGSNLIEASAGTGKTYTIAELYLRLITESGIPVERLLVVTYTNAATAELRERLRARLVAALELLRGDQVAAGGQAYRARLEAAGVDIASARQRIARALLGFDRAAILTIHGFCQRALTDRAFESGMPFASEMLSDQSQLLQQIVDDFWRLQVAPLSPALLAWLMPRGVTPDALATGLRGVPGRPYLQLRGCAMPAALDVLEADYLRCFQQVRELWGSARTEVAALLQESTALNRNRYRIASLPGWLAAMDAYLQEPPGLWFEQFEKFGSSALAAGVKKGGSAPQHQFFERCETLLAAREAMLQSFAEARVALLQRLIDYTRQELLVRKRATRQLYYDDLLINLQQALEADAGGELERALRADYQAALIDEFQDTDPLQYAIFRRLFLHQEIPLFLVGDPKQAIYGFRGADIFTYLQAAEACDTRHTLGANWRSTPALVRAVNNLFNQSDRPFIYSNISFDETAAAAVEQAPLEGDSELDGALCLQLLPASLKREQAQTTSVEAVAREVARLLRLAADGKARVGERPLVGGDIALLVRTNEQGAELKRALLALGIGCVQQAQDDLFHSHTATELSRLLGALVEPEREGLVRAALATDILGFDGNRLAGLDEAGVEAEMIAFRGYHQQWHAAGFIRMIRQLMGERRVAVRLLGFDDGERRLTDLLHLCELLHQQERSAASGMAQLLRWLTRQRLAQVAESDASQLRLESDGELVQIVTIHKSKGLEYPVVFVPFAWEPGARRIRQGEPYQFHDPQQAYAPVLELGSERWELDRHHAQREELAESLRLLYVALTRARCRCYLYWGGVAGAEHSPLAWLLHTPPAWREGEEVLEAMKRHFGTLDAAALEARIAQLAAQSAGAISLTRLPQAAEVAAPKRLPPVLSASVELRARSAPKLPFVTLRTTSFSALSGVHGNVDLPDHEFDEMLSSPVASPAAARTIFTFPRGARAGSCLHAIFERIDFSRADHPPLAPLVASQLELHGMDPSWSDVVCAMIRRVLRTPLDPQGRIRLERVSPQQRLVEMGFHYPLAGVERGALLALLERYGGSGGSARAQAEALARLEFGRLRGYMKGFIDLIFELDGRYYLLDYKSNWLGERAADYDSKRVAQAMAQSGYHLQYLLYVVALHRYLRTRLPDYDYRRHFGGVYYLFLRGLEPERGAGSGVFHDRPEGALIEALDHYIGDAEASR